MTPDAKRDAVAQACLVHGVSQRRAVSMKTSAFIASGMGAARKPTSRLTMPGQAATALPKSSAASKESYQQGCASPAIMPVSAAMSRISTLIRPEPSSLA